MSATGERIAEGGFTLVEALVVVAVTAIVGSIAFPELRQAASQAAFEQAAAGVRADLRIARAQAIRSDAPVLIEVAADGRGYGWSPGPRRGLLGDLRLAPSGGSLRFYPDGSATGGEMALQNARRRLRFEVDSATGLLRGGL